MKFTPPRPSSEILKEIQDLQKEIQDLYQQLLKE